MSEDTHNEYIPPRILVGWSPGDEELELPESAFKPLTEAQQDLVNNTLHNPSSQIARAASQEFDEFPLFYSNKRAPVAAARNLKAYYQGRSVLDSLQAGIELVLADQNYAVYRATNIWSLVWVYLKYRFLRYFSRKKRQSPKMPRYTDSKCRRQKPK